MIFHFSVTRQTALPIRIVQRFCAGGAVGSTSYLMVVERRVDKIRDYLDRGPAYSALAMNPKPKEGPFAPVAWSVLGMI